ncbi:electron transfer flavoprotein subunit beta/FixA family protein [Paenibacillus sp. 1001270B_150601_E10]|uniref:electron transfer flavoprotein subunit beta/FixA family protein n=1 Tax=Paenibacillus sp. 1001270B_150601_E10 TaxID=2787079 RepID=UPI00189E6CA0|nr:electron transfer flavoprotein subunit beta/FixA family protein [Paenibacillus sp. 1001270B_150601_E10]
MSHAALSIAILLKQTFDTEEKLNIQQGRINEEDVKWIINPYDEYAIEAALQWKEQHGGHTVVYTVGPARVTEALRTALAMGVDEAVHIELEDDELDQIDEWGISQCLVQSMKDRQIDLILAGNFSIDQGGSQTAVRLSTLLRLPHTAAITKLERIEELKVAVERDAEGDTEQLEVTLPALFTCQQGLNDPRYPSLAGIMKAKKKPIAVLPAKELLSSFNASSKTSRAAIELPPPRTTGTKLTGSAAEQVQQLITQLKSNTGLFES